MEVLYAVRDPDAVEPVPDDCRVLETLDGDPLDALEKLFPDCSKYVWDSSIPAWAPLNENRKRLLTWRSRIWVVRHAARSSGRSATVEDLEAFKVEQERLRKAELDSYKQQLEEFTKAQEAARAAEQRLKLHSYKTPNEIGSRILESVTEGGRVSKTAFEKTLAPLSHTLLDSLLQDEDAARAWQELQRVRTSLQERDAQSFFMTLWRSLLRLNKNPHSVFVVDSSESGYGLKKPDIGISKTSDKLAAYLVLTTSLKKLIRPGALHHEAISQCSERMQSLLFPQQPERTEFYALAGGADGVELWSWKAGTEMFWSSGILPLDWSKDSDALQLLVRLASTSPESLGYQSVTLPAVLVEGELLTDVRRLDAGDGPLSSPIQKSTTVLLGMLRGKKVVAKRSYQIVREEEALKALEGQVQHIVRAVGKGVDDCGHEWLILQPCGVPLPSGPAADVLRHVLQIAEIIGQLAAAGWSHGDISYANAQVFPDGHAGLIDFGAARRLQEAIGAGEWPTGTPTFMSLTLLRHRLGGLKSVGAPFQEEAAWVSNDLESLLYVFFHIATGGKLVWAGYTNIQREAYDVKFTVMMDEVVFERDLLEKIEDGLLKDAALELRNVFVVDRRLKQNVSVASFVKVLSQFLEKE